MRPPPAGVRSLVAATMGAAADLLHKAREGMENHPRPLIDVDQRIDAGGIRAAWPGGHRDPDSGFIPEGSEATR